MRSNRIHHTESSGRRAHLFQTANNLLPSCSWAIIKVAMKRTTWKLAMIGLLSALVMSANAADRGKPVLSAAQTAVISRQIATLKSPADRKVAENWSEAKKVAELICRPAALPILKKKFKSADRVFLGTEARQSLTLESNRQLTGSGEVRTAHGWKQFSFTCKLNPATAKVAAFQTVLK